MEKHIQLVGILNIVYRSILLLVSFILMVFAASFRHFFDLIVRMTSADVREIPAEILDIIPAILLVVALAMFIVSVAGIIAGAAVLAKKKWGRVLMLVISFFNLLRVPFGTVLGAYSIWVLLHNETIALFQTPRSGV